MPGPRVADMERQMDLIFRGEDWACYGDWAQSRNDFSSHRSLAFGEQAFTIKSKEEPLQFEG
jgi:hypothetical protein